MKNINYISSNLKRASAIIIFGVLFFSLINANFAFALSDQNNAKTGLLDAIFKIFSSKINAWRVSQFAVTTQQCCCRPGQTTNCCNPGDTTTCIYGKFTGYEPNMSWCEGGHWEDTNGDGVADAYYYTYCCFGTVCSCTTQCAPGCTSNSSCNDSNQCTVDTCNNGTCSYAAQKNGYLCNDNNNACTINDACYNGICSGTPKICDDNDPCTSDYCLGYNGNCFFEEITTGICNEKCKRPDGIQGTFENDIDAEATGDFCNPCVDRSASTSITTVDISK